MKIKRRVLQRIILEELQLSSMTHVRLTPSRLVSALRQRGYIAEGETPPSMDQVELGTSIDEQVDRYLAQYEGTSKTSHDDTNESIDWRSDVRSFLTEADDEKKDDNDDEADDDENEQQPSQPSKLTINDIDVENFANDVARLIENYDSLLEVSNTLVRRAVNFIAQNYDDNVVMTLKTALREQHGLVPGKSKNEIESDDFKAPRAGEAGPGGGG